MSQDFSVLLHTPTDGTDGDCTASLKNPRGIEPRRILPQPRGSQAHTCMSPQSSDCLTFIHNLKPSDPSIFFRTPQSMADYKVAVYPVEFAILGNHNLYFSCHIRLVYGFLSLSRKEVSSSSTSSILGRADFKFSGIALLSW